MQIPNIDCLFYTKYGKCNHLDRGRGFLWLGKSCIIHEDFVNGCTKQIKHPRPGPPPGPLPPKKE